MTVRSSDPNNAPLTVRLDPGDGSVAQFYELVSPYPALTLTHRYERPGAYSAFISVSNGSGGYASSTVPVNATGLPLSLIHI